MSNKQFFFSTIEGDRILIDALGVHSEQHGHNILSLRGARLVLDTHAARVEQVALTKQELAAYTAYNVADRAASKVFSDTMEAHAKVRDAALAKIRVARRNPEAIVRLWNASRRASDAGHAIQFNTATANHPIVVGCQNIPASAVPIIQSALEHYGI